MAERSRIPSWRTVPDILAACAEYRADVPLIVTADGASLTGAQLLERSRRGAHALARRGVARGQFVAIDTASLGWTDVAAAYGAVTWLGAVAVMTTSEETERLATVHMGAVARFSATGGGAVLTPADLVDASALAGPSEAEPGDRLDVVFTSGTTGEPKPVSSTHAPWARSVRPEMLTASRVRTVAHTGIPIAVSGGLHGVLLNHLARGVTSLCAATVTELLTAAERHPPAELHLTPHGARALVRQLSGPREWTGQVRVIRIVGGPLPAGLAEALADGFPRARVVSLYGLTEGGAALLVKLQNRSTADSIGRPAPGTEACVLDEQGHPVQPGQTGEVAVRSTGDDTSYYRDDSLNAQWYAGGWTRTGDLGYVGDGGDIRLVGRTKELIFLRAGRIGPETIERILARIVPSDVEIVVAGVRAPSGWDSIAVFLCGNPDDPRLVESGRRLAEMSGPFRPDLVRITERIPRGPAGKPLRRMLVAGLTGDRPGAPVA